MNTPDKATEIKAGLAAVIAFFTALWGWLGWAILIWVFCFLLDYMSGTAAARKNGEWSSDVAREGVWHKLGEIFAVLVAALCDIALRVIVEGAGLDFPALGFEIGPIVTPVVLLWYIFTELGSIIENAEKMGAAVPHWIKKGLKQYRDKLDREADPDGSDPPQDPD
jgi:toxin secretion/phage lysis holin